MPRPSFARREPRRFSLHAAAARGRRGAADRACPAALAWQVAPCGRRVRRLAPVRVPSRGPTVARAAPVHRAECAPASPRLQSGTGSCGLRRVETVGLADAQYDAAVADLEKALKSGRGRLDASTIAIVEHNLQIIDQAINQARDALAADPANTLLEQPSGRSAAAEARSAAPGDARSRHGNELTGLVLGPSSQRDKGQRTIMLAIIVVAMMVITPTDQTVQVAKGTKLDMNNFAGDVNIKVWDKDAVRVEVNHSDRETVDIKQGEQTLTVRSRSLRGGPPRSLDYTITVPSWMAITVGGTYADVTMEGVGGDVSVETTHGDIKVRGGSGFVSLKSVQGEITLEKAKGRIEVRAVNEGIRLADISGDLSAESTNGSIILDRIDSGNVDLYTVNGNISYDGPIKDKGLYRLTTHNGLIAMPIAEKANVDADGADLQRRLPLDVPDSGDTGQAQQALQRDAAATAARTSSSSRSAARSRCAGRASRGRRPSASARRPERERKDKGNQAAARGIARWPMPSRRSIARWPRRCVRSARRSERAMAEAQPEIDAAIEEAMAELTGRDAVRHA